MQTCTPTAMNRAAFFLLRLHALLTMTHGWPAQGAMLDDYDQDPAQYRPPAFLTRVSDRARGPVSVASPR